MKMPQPHFVRDYNRIVRHVVTVELNYEAAMALAVGGGPFAEIGIRQRRILESLGLQCTDYVIDIGAGSGRLATALQDLPNLKYLGTDVVAELLEFARKKSGRDDWNFKVIDTLEIPEKNEVSDFVVFFSVFTHLTEKESFRYLQEAKRVIKKSGTIVISYLDPDVAAQARMAGEGLKNGVFRWLGPGTLNRLLRWRHYFSRIMGNRALNQFLSKKVLDRWAKELNLSIEYMDIADQIGQSVCAFRLARQSDRLGAPAARLLSHGQEGRSR
jgi:ubiquinone/menaquinone biosynthesis C-methylase UbiE